MEEPPSKKRAKKLRNALTISAHRTIEQDVSFGIRQLVDVALKALSPSVNDITTANMCLNHLTPILARLVQRKMGSPYRLNNGRLRLVAPRPTFEDLLDDCLAQIRQNAHGNVSVLRQLVVVVKTVMPLTKSPSRLKALKGQLQRIKELAQSTVPFPAEKQQLLQDCDQVLNPLSTER